MTDCDFNSFSFRAADFILKIARNSKKDNFSASDLEFSNSGVCF